VASAAAANQKNGEVIIKEGGSATGVAGEKRPEAAMNAGGGGGWHIGKRKKAWKQSGES